MSVETVNVVRVSAAGVVEATWQALALRRAVRRGPEGTGGASQTVVERTRWHIDAASLRSSAGDDSARPRRGDQLVSADSGTWVVSDCETATLSTRFACDCVRKL